MALQRPPHPPYARNADALVIQVSQVTLSMSAPNIMVFAMRHSQPRIYFRHVLEAACADRDTFDASSQRGDILPGLRISPVLASIGDDAPQIGFRRGEQDVVGRQALSSRPNSSSIIASMPLSETPPPSLPRCAVPAATLIPATQNHPLIGREADVQSHIA